MDARNTPVKDDAMKYLLISAFALSCLAQTGCTVHNHYYGSSQGLSDFATNGALDHRHSQLADQLEGVYLAMDVIACNIANVDSLGYKSKSISFIEGQVQPQITIDWTVGSATPTNRELDLFIEGVGFLQIKQQETRGGGVAYTRMGNLFINCDGELVLGSANGPRLTGGISLGTNCTGINITPRGDVTCIDIDGSLISVGQITLHRFVAPDGLEALGNGLFLETEFSGPPTSGTPGTDSLGTLLQGHIESSNVHLVMEFITLTKLTHWSDFIAVEIGLSTPEHQPTSTLPPHILPLSEFDILLTHDQ